MKGNVAALAVGVVVSVLAVAGVVSFSLAYQSHAVVKGIQERSIVESVNQMNFIETGLEQSALFSTYQGAYDVSKSGTYQNSAYDTFGKCDISPIYPALLNKIPKNLPYWRMLGAACFDTTNFPSVPSEIEDKIIKPRLEQEISDRFNEYINAIKDQYDIDTPQYKSEVQFLNGETITVDLTTADKIKFDSEQLKLSNLLDKISKTITLPLKRLVDYSIDNFITKAPDPFSEKIEDAHQSMSGVTVQNRIIADPSSVDAKFTNNNLNDGELTNRNIKNCKSTEYKICINPEDVPNFEYNYPKKAEVLPTNCELKFKETVSDNIASLNPSPVPSTKVSIEPKLVETKVDVNDEALCSTNHEANSTNCVDCIKWACKGYVTGGTPVVVGTTEQTLILPSETVVSNIPTCAECVSISGNVCTQFTDMICPSGYVGRDKNYDRKIGRDECFILADKVCPAGHPIENSGQCYKERIPGCNTPTVPCDYNKVSCNTNSFCFEGACTSCSGPPEFSQQYYNCDFIKGCEGTTPCESCLIDPVDKQCPSGTTPFNGECLGSNTLKICPPEAPNEFDNTGHCFKSAQLPSCILHRTLYTKTCNYNYQANAVALVNVKDKENKYPVYDSTEEKTNLRNLELQFYVISRN